jgi:hypothetical protein
MNEIRIISGFVKYFLPTYGSSVENLILYGSLTINDNTVRLNQRCEGRYTFTGKEAIIQSELQIWSLRISGFSTNCSL